MAGRWVTIKGRHVYIDDGGFLRQAAPTHRPKPTGMLGSITGRERTSCAGALMGLVFRVGPTRICSGAMVVMVGLGPKARLVVPAWVKSGSRLSGPGLR